ncbi:uncharacterized protein BDR25DRAFT_344192 [Lindgomyces ingoldianus]|uniref:Uncharacterized protein n=1 Tax=Lindgomyces ingoldianus TaxID=673940 RepID=A0ACB6QQ86_9PLEO|nr:uncharacterized protein BDR25DRAFT_344192 [Lindgomyces ingoldianus]KAF2468447.1 hypothetical protein BDR25DRAFT_344192 [Lindgomyces ingoldianus]
MATPGYSLFELYQTAKKAKQIWNAFTDEFENAPTRVRELIETCDYLSKVLCDFTSLLEEYEEAYPQEESFDRKLLECQAFIDRYWSLKGDYLTELQTHRLGLGSRRTWKQVWQTTRYAYDNKRAQELKDGLCLEIQKLLAFTVVFALRRSAPVNYSLDLSNARDRTIAANSPRPRLDTPLRLALLQPSQEPELIGLHCQLLEFQALFRDLVGVRYSYEREMNSALQWGRPTNIDPIRERLESIWHKLYVRSGLINEDSPTPPLPRDSRELLEAPARSYDQLVINTAAPSMHGGLRTSTDVRQSLQRTNRTRPPNSFQSRPHPPSTYAPSSSGCRTSSITTTSLYNTSEVTPRTTPYLTAEQGSPTVADSLLPESTMSTILSPVATISSSTLPILQRQIKLLSWAVRVVAESHFVEWSTENSTEKLIHFLPHAAFPHVYHSRTLQSLDVTFGECHQVVLTSSDATVYERHIMVEYYFSSHDKRDKFQGDIRDMTHIKAFDVDVIWSNLHPKYDGWHHLAGIARLEKLNLWQSNRFPYHYSLSFLASATSGEQQEYPLSSFSNPPVYTQRSKEARLYLRGRRTTSDTPNDTPVSPNSQPPNRHDFTQPEHICFQFTHKEEYNFFREEYERAHAEEQMITEPRYPVDRVELANTQAPVEIGGRLFLDWYGGARIWSYSSVREFIWGIDGPVSGRFWLACGKDLENWLDIFQEKFVELVQVVGICISRLPCIVITGVSFNFMSEYPPQYAQPHL